MGEQRIVSEAIRNGSEEIFRAFFDAEYENLLYFVRRYVGSSNQAEDLVQESFISLWDNRSRIDTHQNLRTYLYTIARNRALNYLRDRVIHRTDAIEDREAAINAAALESSYIEEQIDALRLEQVIDRIYHHMPDKIKEDFRLHREEGLSYREIALRRGVTEKVIEYHISLALKYFRRIARFGY